MYTCTVYIILYMKSGIKKSLMDHMEVEEKKSLMDHQKCSLR